jgi:hypothetical protein
MYIISVINKINNFTKAIVMDIVAVFVEIVTVFAISQFQFLCNFTCLLKCKGDVVGTVQYL